MFVAPGTVPDFAHKLSREAAERVARNWYLLLLNGLLLIVAGVLIFSIDWSVRSLATFLGALFVLEGISMALTTGIDSRVRQANRHFLPNWWLLLILGLLEVPLGVLALANPGATLAAIITVGGIWAVAVGVMHVILSFEVKSLPKTIDREFSEPGRNGAYAVKPRQESPAPIAS
jgi:uncharacterized membrane protein HdeD (DUF308 family)